MNTWIKGYLKLLMQWVHPLFYASGLVFAFAIAKRDITQTDLVLHPSHEAGGYFLMVIAILTCYYWIYHILRKRKTE